MTTMVPAILKVSVAVINHGQKATCGGKVFFFWFVLLVFFVVVVVLFCFGLVFLRQSYSV